MVKIFPKITRNIFLLIILSRAVFAENIFIEPRVNSPDSFYDYTVSLVEGSYSEVAIDLSLPGTVPLNIIRYYCSHDAKALASFGGWHLNPHCYLSIQQDSSKDSYEIEGKCYNPVSIFLGDVNGITLIFSGWIHLGSLDSEQTFPLLPQKMIGLSNTYCGEMSGQTNLQNYELTYIGSQDQFILRTGDGTIRLYKGVSGVSSAYVLEKEFLPSGNHILYEYSDQGLLTSIQGLDSSEETPFSWITLTYPDAETVIAEGSNKEKAVYHFEKEENALVLSSVERTGLLPYSYEYEIIEGFPRLKKRTISEDNFLELEYHSDEGFQKGKVAALLKPSPATEQVITLATFSYEASYDDKNRLQGILSTVKEISGLEKRLSFNRNHLPEEIELYLDGKYYSKKRNVWKEKGGSSLLLCEKLEDSSGKCLTCNVFSYDEAGNIIERKLHGNLTGSVPTAIECDGEGIPVPSQDEECLLKKFTYSSDGRNLLVSEKDSKGSTARYTYLDGTNLLSSKHYFSKGAGCDSFRREFYDYDTYKNLIEIMIDDGKNEEKGDIDGISHRFTTTIDYSQSFRSFGLPTEITKTGRDQKNTERIHRIILDYDDWGNIKSKTLYGNTDDQPRVATFEYNDENFLESLSESSGNHHTFTYDEIGRLKTCIDHLKGMTYTNIYGPLNTVAQEQMTSSTEKTLTSSFAFDHQNHLVSRTDGFGRNFKYNYDPLGRLVELSLPTVKDQTGQLSCPTFTYEYDTLGNLSKTTDPKGYVEEVETTIRGQRTATHYPDGTFELFKYDQEGSLHRHYSRQGLTRVFEYDLSGQIAHIEVNKIKDYDDDDYLFSCEYKNTHFIQESSNDRLGKYHYSYSPAAVLNKITSENKEEEIDLIPGRFGEPYQVRKYFGLSDVRVETVKRDEQERAEELSITNSDGLALFQKKISYSPNGEEVTIHHLINEDSEKLVFDSFGDLIQTVDGKGRVTHFETKVFTDSEALYLKRITTLPSKAILEEVFDALSRLVQVTVKDDNGKFLKQIKYSYDLLGNLTGQKVADIADGDIRGWQTAEWVYGPCHRLDAQTEHKGTQSEQKTFYGYDAFGRLRSLRYEGEENTLTYSYGEHGFLDEILSKGGEKDLDIHHKLDRNNKGMVTQARTKTPYESRKLHVNRSFDNLGRIEFEEIEGGYFRYQISYSYDRLGRVSSITLPDYSRIEYEYDALYPRKVIRKNLNGKEIGVHHFQDYDLSGNLKCEILPGSCGMRTSQHKNGALTQTLSPTFSQEKDASPSDLSYSVKTKYPFKEIKHRLLFDAIGRLVEEKGGENTKYAYDSLGNILKKGYIYDTPNQLVKAHEKEFTYDKRGNLKTRTRFGKKEEFFFNGLDQLVRYVSPSGEEIIYIYDAFGRRIKKKSFFLNGPLKEIWYLYVGDVEIGTIDSFGNIQELQIPADPQDPDTKMIGYELGKTFLVPSYDLFGNLSSLTDSSTQKVVEAYSYSAYGKETIYNFKGDTIDQSKWENPWRYQGKRKDPETGFIYFGHRYYDPDLGRFISPDPISDNEGNSPYQFCNSNPLDHKDSFGLEAEPRDSNKFKNYFYGEVEDHCYCESHRDCKKGSNLTGCELWYTTTYNPLSLPSTNMISNVMGWGKAAMDVSKGMGSLLTHDILDDLSGGLIGGHEKIDSIFGTDYAKCYTPEAKAKRPKITMAALPPPGSLVGTAGKIAQIARSSGAIGGAIVGSAFTGGSSISPTQENQVRGWKVGAPINNLTSQGDVPQWSTVRYRYWRNEALIVKNGIMTKALESDCYELTDKNLRRMERGLAPQKMNIEKGRMESVELHHNPAQRDGGLFDVEPLTPEMHAQQDSYRHIGN